MSPSNKLLVLNSGSSSLKFKLYQVASGGGLSSIASGLCERIGDISKSSIKATVTDGTSNSNPPHPTVSRTPFPDHTTALKVVSDYLKDRFDAEFTSDVRAVGHRVVHGLTISKSVLINDQVRKTIEDASSLAPIHNPPNLQGIAAATKIFPAAAQVAVFDTAFHQTMTPDAFMYALPYDLYTDRHVRRYGFHGTSYKYLTERTAVALNKHPSEVNAILCHLGAGSSMCAVQGGLSVDTTMGMTPLEGLVMGSRCGDVDPALPLWLQNAAGMTADEVDTLLNKKSGFLGLAGNVDLRSVMENAHHGDEKADLAVSVFIRRVRKYLGAYWMHLNGDVDAIVFSAGIGENSPELRKRICGGMRWAGVDIDESKNEKAIGSTDTVEIQSEVSKVKVLVIPTDEELSIAEQTLEVVKAQEKATAAAA
jgi:acetate kinase